MAVVSTEKQLEKILSIKDETAVEKIMLMDPVEADRRRTDADVLCTWARRDGIQNWKPTHARLHQTIWPRSSTPQALQERQRACS